MAGVNVPPPVSPASPFDPALAAAGQTYTLATLCGLFVLTVLPFVAALVQGQASEVPRHLAYALGTALLLRSVWRGGVWSWRVTVGLSIVAGLLVFMGGMFAGQVSWQGWVVSAAGLAFIACGLLLVGHPAIRAFLDGRWAARGRA
ncbi:hypothetical protein [Deinococcus wulumuqiensis]|uniref:hypothetical protein n=1 Tax=Deinococcus wulumuqiensis TaxID=980427 RepID=UPI002432D0E0|nr:hypothetical protein [Deinococcus wulumuqiensis]